MHSLALFATAISLVCWAPFFTLLLTWQRRSDTPPRRTRRISVRPAGHGAISLSKVVAADLAKDPAYQ